MSKYAIRVEEDNLDLIEKLNDGVRPIPQDDKTMFVFETDESKDVKNDIVWEDDLYDENGCSKDTDLNWLI